MHESGVFLIILTILSALGAALQPYVYSCRNVQFHVVDGRYKLRANCHTQTPMGPPWICTELDLGHCFGVVMAQLIAYPE